MKFRLTLGLLAIVAGLVFGFSALPSQAHAATAATLSSTDLSNMQSVLDLTKATLDTVQLQINRDAIQDRASTLAILGNIKVYLLNMRGLLGGTPVTMLIEEPEPVALSPVAYAPQAPVTSPVAPTAPVALSAPSGEVAGSAAVNETAPQDQQTASVSFSANSQRAFWIILITAIIIAIILAIPRKKKEDVMMLQDMPQGEPQAAEPPGPEEIEPVQSA